MPRTKGARGRKTKVIQQMLDDMGFDPIKNMCRLAIVAEKRGNLVIAAMMNKEIAKYFAPQLKAIEVTTNSNSGGVLVVPGALNGDQWQEHANQVIEGTAERLLEEMSDDA